MNWIDFFLGVGVGELIMIGIQETASYFSSKRMETRLFKAIDEAEEELKRKERVRKLRP